MKTKTIAFAIAAAAAAFASAPSFAQWVWTPNGYVYGEAAPQTNSGAADNHTGIERYPGLGAHPPAGTVIVNPNVLPNVLGGILGGDVRNWNRYSVVPDAYRSRSYALRDWYNRGLSRPPSGHQWIAANGDYYLINRSNGVIVQRVG